MIDKKGIEESIKRVLNSEIDCHVYSSPKGIKELREKIADFLFRIWGITIDSTNLLITTGSQQSINLVVDSILKQGDTVFLDQPTYFGAIDVFKRKNLNLVGLEVKDKGIDIKNLEKKITKYLPKLIYIVPTFNNPTGIAWDLETRKDFLKIINKYNIQVLEDDPYSLISYYNKTYSSLYQLNNGRNITYLGTFSKMISPAINIGYILSNTENINNIYVIKQSYDLCTSTFLQYVVLDYLEHNDLEKLMKEKGKRYLELWKENQKLLEKNYKDKIISYTKPKGGLFFHVKFNENIDREIFDNGNQFYITDGHENESRINICHLLNS